MINNSYILNKLTNFKNKNSQLEILKRPSPFKTNFFLKKYVNIFHLYLVSFIKEEQKETLKNYWENFYHHNLSMIFIIIFG